MKIGKSWREFCPARTTAVSSFWLFVNLLAVVGCQQEAPGRPDRAAVSGSVTYRGSALPGGVVTFTLASDSMQTASCVLQSNGTYSVADAPIGEAIVTVDTHAIRGGAIHRFVEIPARYSQVESSELACTIKEHGNQSVNFQLE